MRKFNIITLCGSTRFHNEFIQAQQEYTEKGYIVLPPMLFNIRAYCDNESFMKMIHEMHLQKIDMADEIFVINKGGYIGESTKSEIAYAERHGKKIRYLE